MCRSFYKKAAGASILICLIFFSLSPAFAAISVSASVDRKAISENESVLLTITIENGTGDESIQIPENDAYLIQSYGTSNQTSIINRQVTRSTLYSYQWIPKKTGLLRIPEILVFADGQIFKTEAISLQVLTEAESQNSSAKNSSEVNSQELIVELQMDKNTLYVDEPAVLVFRLLSPKNVNLQSVKYEPPSLKDFLSEPYGKQQNGRITRNGVLYDVVELKTLLYPTKAGKFTVGPAAISGQMLKRIASRNRSRNSFSLDDFFGESLFDNDPFFSSNVTRIPVNRKTNTLEVTVNPLPDFGKPADFSGTVGQYKMNVETPDLQQIKKGDAITLTITIEGFGHIASIAEPKIQNLQNFKVFESEVQTIPAIEEGKIGGKKIFKKIIVPEKSGRLILPTLHFDFFDNSSGIYQNQTHKGVEIQVQDVQSDPNAGKVFEAANPSSSSVQKVPIQILGQDILFSLPDSSFLKPMPTKFSWAPLGFLCGAGALFYGVLWKLVQNMRRRRNDPALLRERTAHKKFRADISSISPKETTRKNFSALHKAISDYIGNKLDLPGAVLTPKEMEEKLLPLGALGQQLRTQAETLDHWQYGLAQSETKAWKHLLESVKQTIAKVEASWGKMKK